MIFPGVIAQQQLLSIGGGVLWNPLDMASVPQIYLDAQDSSVTDVSGSASVISNLGAMGSDGNFLQTNASRRPTIVDAELNGKRILRFDGTADLMTGSTTAQRALGRFKSATFAFAVYKKRTADGSATTRILFSVPAGTSGARFAAYAGLFSDINKPSVGAKRLDADTFNTLPSASAVSKVYCMAGMFVDYSSGNGAVHVDGNSPATGSITTSGNTSNTASVDPLSIGAFANLTGFSDIDLAALVISDANPSSGDIDRLFGWAAHKYGLTANLPSGHPYKTTPPYA